MQMCRLQKILGLLKWSSMPSQVCAIGLFWMTNSLFRGFFSIIGNSFFSETLKILSINTLSLSSLPITMEVPFRKNSFGGLIDITRFDFGAKGRC